MKNVNGHKVIRFVNFLRPSPAKNPQIRILPVIPQILSANFVRSLPVQRSASPHFTGGL